MSGAGAAKPKPLPTTEVFRFVCGRPAIKEDRSIVVKRPARRITTASTRFLRLFGSESLEFGDQIAQLADALHLDEIKFEVGRNIKLQAELVQKSVSATFANQKLSSLVDSTDWRNDINHLDGALYDLWVLSSDDQGVGHQIGRYRQLYDVVGQVVEVSLNKDEKDGKVKPEFWLKGLEIGGPDDVIDDTGNDGNDGDTQPAAGGSTVPRRLVHQPGRPIGLVAAADTAQIIQDLLQALQVLNSSSVFNNLKVDTSTPTILNLDPAWISQLLPAELNSAVSIAVAKSTKSPVAFSDYYEVIQRAISDASTSSTSTPSSKEFKAGIFSIGNFHLELTQPWSIVPGQAIETSSDGATNPALPTPQKSKIKPTGVGDLLVVRDHLWKYVGGDVGAIENVLTSEWLIRETKRLDTTEVVDVSSTEVQTENEREEIQTTRFALSKESTDIQKQDSATKMGVSATASYGPYVTVKGDYSSAQNNASETANKVASQYSQDLTSRATSKIIEKTFHSVTKTTISSFQENYRHEFKNTGGNATNISGVYQWVNKVSQCQMWNYGKRLLIDIVIPEPAAFLMTQSGSAGPALAAPAPLTEKAADLYEGNFSNIAARYQATGIKPPLELIMSFSKSFKADAPTSGGGPKLGGGDPWHFGGTAMVNMDIDIPAGYMAYAAIVQVGIRTGKMVRNWNIFQNQVYPEFDPDDSKSYPQVKPFISLAGRVIAATQATAADLGASTGTVSPQEQDFIGAVSFLNPLLKTSMALSIAQDFCLALSGTIQICCVRNPSTFMQWQQDTYDSIVTAYTKLKMDYDRSRAETAISSMTVTTGNNPLENVSIINTELKKASIEFMSTQNFEVFGTVKPAADGIPEVAEKDMHTAILQGSYADFFEKAFEWENMTYTLLPYFWANRATWQQRINFTTPDPTFSAFVKAGMAKVTVPVRFGFGLEAIHFLETGKPWQKGPVTVLTTSEYYSMAQEILEAEAKPAEVKVSEPWYTVIPTELVQLRKDDVLPRFKPDGNGVWVERKPTDPDWDM